MLELILAGPLMLLFPEDACRIISCATEPIPAATHYKHHREVHVGHFARGAARVFCVGAAGFCNGYARTAAMQQPYYPPYYPPYASQYNSYTTPATVTTDYGMHSYSVQQVAPGFYNANKLY